jgi:hypothetical protein
MKHLAIRVTNKYESEAVQKALFDMGFKWSIVSNVNLIENTYFKIEYQLLLIVFIEEISPVSGMHLHFYYKRNDEQDSHDLIEISSSDFFSKYARHIEMFPDYVEPKLQTLSKKTTLETFKDKKIAVIVDGPEQNIEIQKKLLSIGIVWGVNDENIHYVAVNSKTIFIKNNRLFYCYTNCSKCNLCPKDHDCYQYTRMSGKQFLDKYFPEDNKPKFKVGDYLWHVWDESIVRWEIVEILYENDKYSYDLIENEFDECIMSNEFEDDIDCTDIGDIFSTPELAAKRFLELNK